MRIISENGVILHAVNLNIKTNTRGIHTNETMLNLHISNTAANQVSVIRNFLYNIHSLTNQIIYEFHLSMHVTRKPYKLFWWVASVHAWQILLLHSVRAATTATSQLNIKTNYDAKFKIKKTILSVETNICPELYAEKLLKCRRCCPGKLVHTQYGRHSMQS